MTTSVTAKTRTVGELLGNDSQYRVPDYQRNYAWQAAEINQLIEDIHHAEQADLPRYFLGNLVTTEHAHTSVYDVIDGQQRMTTLVLLFAALRISLGPHETTAASSTESLLTFAARPQASAALKRLARVSANLTANTEKTPLSHAAEAGENALAGPIFFSTTLSSREKNTLPPSVQGLYNGYTATVTALADAGLTSPQALNKFKDYLLRNVEVIQVVLPPETDLNRYFEVMNTRGVQLEPTDIIRARLMDALDKNQIRTFQLIWDACAQMDDYIQMTVASNDPGLRTKLFGQDWKWLQTLSFDELTKHLGTEPDKHDGSKESKNNAGPDGDPRSLEAMLVTYTQDGPEDSSSKSDDARYRAYRSTIRFPFFLLHALILFAEREGLSLLVDEPKDSGISTQYGADDRAEHEPTLDDRKLIKQFEQITNRKDSALVARFAIHLLQVRNLFDAYIIRREEMDSNAGDGAWTLKNLEMVRSKKNGRRAKGKTPTYRNTYGQDTENKHEADREHQDIVLLESMLRITYTSPRTMRWITRVLRLVLEHHFPENETPRREKLQASKLNDSLRNYARDQLPDEYRQQPTGTEPQNIDEKRLTGFNIPRLVFAYLDFLMLDHELLNYPTEQQYSPVPKASFRFRFRNSIEHFAPSTEDQEITGEKVDEARKQSLGNLALITVSQNSKFSNLSPGAKAQETKDDVLQQSPKLWRMAHLTREATRNKDSTWNNEMIDYHQTECLEILANDLSGGTFD